MIYETLSTAKIITSVAYKVCAARNKIRLKRKRFFQDNKYKVATTTNLIESTNILPDTTGDHSKLNNGNHEQQQNKDEEIDFSHPANASHQKLNKLNFSSDTDEEKMK